MNRDAKEKRSVTAVMKRKDDESSREEKGRRE